MPTSKRRTNELIVKKLNAENHFSIGGVEITALANSVLGASFVIGSETGGNTINVGIQLEDADGNALAARASVYAYLSDDADGDSIAATAPSGGVAIGTDGIIDEVTAGKSFFLHSEADGDIDIDIVEAGADTWYLVVVLTNGLHVVSGAITFA